MLARSANPGLASIKDWPSINSPGAVNTLNSPINKPPATIAGMIGTKISDNPFTARCTQFCFSAPAEATSLVDISTKPVNFAISA
ncbi:Uncharacterised protein [Vibrio cholerae]|nr:Uncharacterised protein [Vibrio cholerae]